MDKICPKCNGNGEIMDNKIGLWVDCQKCDGTSRIPEDKTRTTEEIIEELENCFLGHDEYILHLLAELKVSRDKEIEKWKIKCMELNEKLSSLIKLLLEGV